MLRGRNTGAKYVGEFKNGRRSGQGTYTTEWGYSYVGEWSLDSEHGHGTEIFPNGDRYVGMCIEIRLDSL
ncbi:MAG TPA: hypothetical protein EYO71_10420 [Rhodospirillales bacterium]|nr:hypothetical protein [Rhodospirillales bacterium]